MRQRNYKYFILCVLALFGGVLLFSQAGCSDDPESSDAKQIRQQTAQALEMSAKGADRDTLMAAQNKVQSSLIRHNEAGNLTKDTAVLTSGNLAMARAGQMQADLDLKMLPLRQSINAFERLLRSSDDLDLEKGRIQALLAGGQQEMVELEQLLKGDTQQAGLEDQLDDAQAELDQLLAQKKQEQAQKDKVQAVLDDYQAQADNLIRKAELTSGDEKLKLEKEAYSILKDRKDYYIQAQASENKIAVLDGRIELVQARVDGVGQSIRETEKRIGDIDNSPTRMALKQQTREIEQTLSVNQQQLASDAGAIKTAFDTYGKDCQDTCGVFQEAAAEFERIRSRQVSSAAKLQLAQSYYYAALTCSGLVREQLNVSERLQDLFATGNPAFVTAAKEKLSGAMTLDPQESKKVMELFDKAIEAYGRAFGATMGQEAKCSVLKSQLLAIDSKMRLADILGLSEMAQQAEAKIQELMQQGQEYGVSFTQSQTKKLLESGIDYTPSLPINLEVLAEGLQKKLTAWKRLPITEQEPVVQQNLLEIDELIGRYGEVLGEKLEPLKQEMLAAQERGFKEDVAPTTSGGGSSEPNNVGGFPPGMGF